MFRNKQDRKITSVGILFVVLAMVGACRAAPKAESTGSKKAIAVIQELPSNDNQSQDAISEAQESPKNGNWENKNKNENNDNSENDIALVDTSEDEEGTQVVSPEGATAIQLLTQHCARCHNVNNAQGGLGDITNVEALVSSNKWLVPGKPEESLIYTRLMPVGGNMPPAGGFSDANAKLIAIWITNLKLKPRDPLTDTDMYALIAADLAKVPADEKRNTRYFTLQNLNNKSIDAARINTVRDGFIKTLNFLSRAPEIYVPTAIDPQKLIYRVNLESIELATNDFNDMIERFYPFTKTYDQGPLGAIEEQASSDLRTSQWLIRADWFAATATLPVHYAQLLNLPNTLQDLEDELQVDTTENILENRVYRSGFKNSGVSANNRIIERHTSESGRYYWLSYDFAESQDNQNIFENPLAQRDVDNGGQIDSNFSHDGGEVIFELPNGLMGFYLATDLGDRIDKGPVNIVRNTNGPVEFLTSIVNGMSCMSCHALGILDKKDQVRNLVMNSADFSDEEKDRVAQLYPDSTTFTAKVKSDTAKYVAAIKKLGISENIEKEVVNGSFRIYNNVVRQDDVLAELGINKDQLTDLLGQRPFDTDWAGLLAEGGFVTREEFNLHFSRAIEEVREDVRTINPSVGDSIITGNCMVADPLLMNLCVNTDLPDER